jgi:hypothetical protein
MALTSAGAAPGKPHVLGSNRGFVNTRVSLIVHHRLTLAQKLRFDPINMNIIEGLSWSSHA